MKYTTIAISLLLSASVASAMDSASVTSAMDLDGEWNIPNDITGNLKIHVSQKGSRFVINEAIEAAGGIGSVSVVARGRVEKRNLSLTYRYNISTGQSGSGDCKSTTTTKTLIHWRCSNDVIDTVDFDWTR